MDDATFASKLVRIYGFTGAEAEREEAALMAALGAGEPYDYGALGHRAKKNVELRPVLKRLGLPEADINRVLSGRFTRPT